MARSDQDSLEVEASRVRASEADDASDNELVLWVRLTREDPLTGSIGDQVQSASLTFHGWIDFMSAINALRRPAATP